MLITDNNFKTSDLSPFSRFYNLVELRISSNYWRKYSNKKNIANNFYGSLVHLQELTKLKRLHIENTDINSGLQYLPESLEEFLCYDKHREKPGAKATELYMNELYDFNKKDDDDDDDDDGIGSDIKGWKEEEKK